MTLTAITFAPDNIRTGIDIEVGGTVAASAAAVRRGCRSSSLNPAVTCVSRFPLATRRTGSLTKVKIPRTESIKVAQHQQ